MTSPATLTAAPMLTTRVLGGNILPDKWQPTKNDVIIGRGKKVYGHEGNQKLRELVQKEVQAYSNAKNRAAKSAIIIRIFQAVRADSEIGFVKKDPATKKYFAVEDTAAKITIAQYFRDALADGYKSSKQYKQKLRDALKRSVSDAGQETTPMMGINKMTTMKRSASVGDPAAAYQLLGPLRVSRAIFEDTTTDSMDAPLPHRELSCSEAVAPSNSRMQVRNILQSASTLLDDSEGCDWSSTRHNSDTMVEESNITTGEDMLCSSSKNSTFASLYKAFGSNVDMSCDPFEPTPLKEEKRQASPFNFNYEDAFGQEPTQTAAL